MHGLPPDAATWRAEQEWTQRDELLAALIQVTDRWGLINALLHNPKHPSRLPKPVQITRPSDRAAAAERKPVETDPRRIAAFFANRPR